VSLASRRTAAKPFLSTRLYWPSSAYLKSWYRRCVRSTAVMTMSPLCLSSLRLNKAPFFPPYAWQIGLVLVPLVPHMKEGSTSKG
jgi:hypothetical protein